MTRVVALLLLQLNHQLLTLVAQLFGYYINVSADIGAYSPYIIVAVIVLSGISLLDAYCARDSSREEWSCCYYSPSTKNLLKFCIIVKLHIDPIRYITCIGYFSRFNPERGCSAFI